MLRIKSTCSNRDSNIHSCKSYLDLFAFFIAHEPAGHIFGHVVEEVSNTSWWFELVQVGDTAIMEGDGLVNVQGVEPGRYLRWLLGDPGSRQDEMHSIRALLST